MSATINVTSFVGGNLMGIGTTATSWGKKFMEALKLTTISIGVFTYLASLPTFNFNKIRSDFY